MRCPRAWPRPSCAGRRKSVGPTALVGRRAVLASSCTSGSSVATARRWSIGGPRRGSRLAARCFGAWLLRASRSPSRP
eukprot:15473551-Alexandrium_andersonii.AAC.1